MGLENPLHLAILFLVILLLFGARRLPELGRSLGEGMRGFKDSISGDPQSGRPAVDPGEPPASAPPTPPASPQTAPPIAAPEAPAVPASETPAPAVPGAPPASADPAAATPSVPDPRGSGTHAP